MGLFDTFIAIVATIIILLGAMLLCGLQSIGIIKTQEEFIFNLFIFVMIVNAVIFSAIILRNRYLIRKSDRKNL